MSNYPPQWTPQGVPEAQGGPPQGAPTGPPHGFAQPPSAPPGPSHGFTQPGLAPPGPSHGFNQPLSAPPGTGSSPPPSAHTGSFGPGGPGQQRKSRKPLIIALIAGGGAVVMLALALVAVFVWGAGTPTLTAAQFDRFFAAGDTYLGETITTRTANERRLTNPGPTGCSAAIVRSFEKAKDWMTAGAANPEEGLVAARYQTSGDARDAFMLVKECGAEAGNSGSVDGANWVQVKLEYNRFVVVQAGNVVAIAISHNDDEKTIAKEIMTEFKESAK